MAGWSNPENKCIGCLRRDYLSSMVVDNSNKTENTRQLREKKAEWLLKVNKYGKICG